MKKRILILGASGNLGSELYNYFKDNIDMECFGTCFSSPTKGLYVGDMSNRDELKKILELTNPSIVINSIKLGGHLNSDQEKMKSVNALINKHLVELFDGKIVYFSTDHVFDGEKGDYIETDKPNPTNLYGRVKFLGEEILSNSNNDHLILRLGMLYSDKLGSFTKFVHDSLKEGKKIDTWDDIFTCPTHMRDVCFYVDKLLQQEKNGIYHIAGSQKLSRYQFSLLIAQKYGLDKNLINSIKCDQEDMPKNTSLKSIKIATGNNASYI